MTVSHSPSESLYQPRRAWFMTGVLCLLLLLSFVDRYSLTVLVDPVRQEFHLSDGQMGLLLGASFAIFYSLFGVPLGWLVDRVNRRNLVVAGVLIWSVMTIASGLSTSFAHLLIARMGVGVGEAVLTPAAFSLIRDAFPEQRRGRALSVYLFGANVGTGFSLVAVGSLLHVLDGSTVKSALGLVAVADWRLVLIVIGSIGIPLGLLAMFIVEPARGSAGSAQDSAGGEFMRELRLRWPVYALLTAAFTVWGSCTYSIGAWLPTALSRGWGVPAGTVASTYGAIAMIAAPFAAILTSTVLDRLATSGRMRALPLACAVTALVLVPAVVIAPLALSRGLTWTTAGLQVFGSMCIQVMLSMLIAQIAPGRIVGRVTAGCYLAMNLFGLGLAPTLVATAADAFPAGNTALGLGLSVVAGTAWVLFTLVVLSLWRAHRNQGDVFMPTEANR